MEKIKIKNPFLFIILLISNLFLFSCQKKSEKIAVNSNFENFETGKHLKFITTRADSTISYDLYLPKNYNFETKYPVVICFDAHARGGIPVNRMKLAAETYNYVIVGSNNVKNGIDDFKNLFEIVFNDVKLRISIDENRVYLSGFSGGARMATNIAIESNKIKGVIACGAAFPQQFDVSKINFSFYGLVGKNDFNYQEFVGLEKYFTDETPDIYVKYTADTHTWPDENEFKNAFLWLSLKSMKNKYAEEDDNLIDSLFENAEKNYEEFKYENNIRKEIDDLYEIVSFYKNLKKTSKYEKLLNNLLIQFQAVEMFKKEDEYLVWENELKNKFLESFTIKSVDWWQNEINTLKKASNDKDDQIKANMCARMLEFLGMVCYVKISSANMSYLFEVDIEKLFTIYKMLEPQNPDMYFYLAKWDLISKKNNELAIEKLQKSVETGYFDFEKIASEPSFEPLREKSEFKMIVNKARENYVNSK